MTSEYKADSDTGSSSTNSNSDCSTETSDDETNLLMGIKDLNRKQKKTKKKSRKSRFPLYPRQQAYHAPSSYHPAHFHPYYPPNSQSLHSDVQSLYDKLNKQIQKNKEQKIRKKEKKIQRKKENRAALKLQEWWKSMRVVRNWRDPLSMRNIQRLMLNNEIANEFVDTFVSEYLLSEFIPDLLIDILSNKTDEYKGKDVISQLVWSFYQEIEKEICTIYCIEICHDTINEVVQNYFNSDKNRLQITSIYTHSQKEILHEVTLEELEVVVNESIEELIADYLIECKAKELYTKYVLTDIISDVIKETYIGYILEHEILNEYLLTNCLNKWIKVVATEQYKQHKNKKSMQKKNKEYDLIETSLIDHFLNEELLHIFINKLSSRSQQSFINQQTVNVLLHTEMSKILIRKHMALHTKHSKTKQNVILNEMLIKLLCDTSIDHFIDYLKAES